MVTGNGDFNILQQTIEILDDVDIDFLVYVSGKSELPKLKSKFSKVRLIEGSIIKWGQFSEIQAELILIRKALQYNYDYFHLINLNDFPLMDKKHFKKFFSNKPIKIGFSEYLEKFEFWQIQHKYPFKFIDLQKNVIPGIYVRLVNVIGRLFNVNKIKDPQKIEKGFKYFSLPRKYVEKINSFSEVELFNNTLDGMSFFNQMVLKELKPDDFSVNNSIYSRKMRIMKSAQMASRLVNYLRVDNFNWFYFPEYKYSEKDFALLRNEVNKNIAFVHSVKSGERPISIFQRKG